MKEVQLPSGAMLKIQLSPFAISKGLWQALISELKQVDVQSSTNVTTLYKSLFCTGFSSGAIEAALWKCFERCTYNDGRGDLKIDSQTFEPENNRQDYVSVCIEVAKENTLPFVKSLYAEFQRAIQILANTQA